MPQFRTVVAARDDLRINRELELLASTLAAVDIGPGAPDLADDRDRLVTAIRFYLIPRMVDPAIPMTVVLVGPTGSGKSTLVNSLTARDLTKTGAIRPTTTAPVVLTSEDNVPKYETVAGVPCDVVAGSAPILDSMVLVDTPDIDSTAVDHRAVAEALVDSADVVVFVTSALRYADDVAWQVLRRARERGVDVIHVLNRVVSTNSGAVVDYKARLREEGFADELVTIPEHHLHDDGQRIPSLAVRSLARRLATIAANRAHASNSTLMRVRDVTLRQIADLARSIAERSEGVEALSAELSLTLATNAAGLDFAETAPRVVDAPPGPTGRWATLRWRRRHRLDDEAIRSIEGDVIDGITAVVLGSIRLWAIEHEAAMDLDLVSVPRTIRARVEGWVRFVARMVSEHSSAEPILLEAALFQTSLGDTLGSAVERLAGADAPDLVGRARRELETRVGSIYDEIARLIVTSHRDRLGELDATGVRGALGTVMATPSLIDA